MARETNAAIMTGVDLDTTGHAAAVAAAEAAYPGLSAVRAYDDTTTGYIVVTMGLTAVDQVAAPLNVIVDGTTVLYAERRTDAEPYSQIVARVEEALTPAHRRPYVGALGLTGNLATRTAS
jgi:hypothetical protein